MPKTEEGKGAHVATAAAASGDTLFMVQTEPSAEDWEKIYAGRDGKARFDRHYLD